MTAWTRTQLRPNPYGERVEDLSSVYLPTAASHLTLHFTADAGLAFEKSPVRPERDHDVEVVLVIPRTRVTESETSPLSKPESLPHRK